MLIIGIKIVGGINNKPREPGFGIFVKRILPRGRAAEDGKTRISYYYSYIFLLHFSLSYFSGEYKHESMGVSPKLNHRRVEPGIIVDVVIKSYILQ